jgi:protein-S-isoprenylcysteine O-methyltransferase Ste14
MNAKVSESVDEAPPISLVQVVGGLVAVIAFLGLTFWSAGTVAWWPGWIYLGLLAFSQTLNSIIIGKQNPELLKRRGSMGEGTPVWDRACLGMFGLAFGVMFVVAALDTSRYGWTQMPGWLLWPGIGLHLGGIGLLTWSMLCNPFFEKSARLQTDRDQQVVDHGPYQYMRHPGYTGTIVGFIVSAPFVLGSWWAFLPAAVSAGGLVVRTVLEDQMLREGLDGYKEYADRVRYRLLPGIW